MKRYLYIISIIISFFSLSFIAQAQTNQTVFNGTATTAVNFPGSDCTYNWVNDNPAIGLAASGTGNIPSFTAVNTGTGPVTTTITATPVPTRFAYVTNEYDGTVSVINIANNKIVATIPVGTLPQCISISPDGSLLYVLNYSSSTISVINTSTNLVIATINDSSAPTRMSLSPDGSTLYVTNSFAGTVSVFDTKTFNKLSTIAVGYSPIAVTVSPDGKSAYVIYNNDILVINTATNTVVSTIFEIGSTPESLIVSPDGGKLYVANFYGSSVAVINTATNSLSTAIPVGSSPSAVTISPDGSILYVANDYSNSVSVINTATNMVTATIAVGGNPQGISISPDGSQVYVTNSGSNSVSVINTATNALVSTIPVGSVPIAIGSFNVAGSGCVSVKFTITVNPVTFPTITITGSPSPLTTIYGTPSTSTAFTVSGANLTTGILVTPPTGFEVSTDDINYSSTVTVGGTGTIASTTIYIRLASSTPVGGYSGNIVLSSTGATNVNIEMPVSMVTPAPLTITSDNKSKALGEANPVLTATYSGFVNSDGPAQLTTQPVITTIALTASPAGQYSITAAGATDPNYMITYVPGVLTINPQPQTITVPNAFTPNGDGVNDTWDIKYLSTFPNCTVAVFNRWGQNVYSSTGYGIPWDGTYRGAALPTSTYYYIVNLMNGSKALSGFVAIVK